jgi:phage head maturation protease
MAAKSDRAKVTGTERRAYPVKLETRAQAGGVVTLEGYASVTEQSYEMWDWCGPYGEVMRQGAFTKTLSENPQTQLLLNHGGLSMAYTRAGTLRLVRRAGHGDRDRGRQRRRDVVRVPRDPPAVEPRLRPA